ncbi:MmgE/PrpD family protein [Rhodoferax sediminis]|uniref:MmgE/PrpD family protein n=1 Tax=Rhodoferax sediminis TaxID=2509614 RepID=A0A515DDX8_9BURK|nr:MmgE/PrpD family protein [Rhodoferax sediminis]QDL38621.1 MmgE/PrpD family protein [Rhodoferax sediminis]
MALLHELSKYAVAEVGRTARREITRHAKRAVLDWLAATYPGTRCAPALQLVQACRDELGVGASSVVGFGTTSFPATAAWINGSASHAVEFDDIYREAVYHPGSPTVAAALAIAEARDASGGELLAAVVVGYEVATRIGAALQPSHVRRFHATGTIGCLGAAVAAAVLLRPRDAQAVRHAMATAATFASGLQQALRSEAMTKPLHAGHAAAVGVRAAQAAAHGVTGAADILEAELGLGAVMAEQTDWSRATQGLGESYHIARVTHKVHACCGHIFPAIDAALALRARHGIDAGRIAAIHVASYPQAVEATGRFEPRTPYEAKFSLPYAVSHALVHGSVGLDAFASERLASAEVRALMRLCTLEAVPELGQRFPSRRDTRVTIRTTDGAEFAEFRAFRRGDPEFPLADAELDAKFEALSAPVIGAARAQALRAQVWRLDELRVRDLRLALDNRQ